MLTRLSIVWYRHRRLTLATVSTLAVLLLVGIGTLVVTLVGAAPEKQALSPVEAPQLETHAKPGGVNKAEVPVPVEGARPVRLQAADIDLDAKVTAVGLNPDGTAKVPADAGTVGWYEPLGIPDHVGSDVLVGHVNYKGEPGAFLPLEELQKGQALQVTVEGGEVREYVVESVDSYPKRKAPLKELYDPNGEERLVLITCGGEFDSVVHHYDHNTVVVAVPK